MPIISNPASKATVAFEDVLKGLSSTLAPDHNLNGCVGSDKKK
ncbi:hypothetical protein QBD01_002803 [Ochrobactrum sp. 19YEA23]|nr:hypothetical protein [Ochrobactrum sp. 19YEA23]